MLSFKQVTIVITNNSLIRQSWYHNRDNKKNLTKCSSFNEKKELEICLTEKEKITSGKIKIKEKRSFENQPMNISLSLQSSIDKKSKIKYLD